MSTKTNRSSGLRNGLLLGMAIAASVGIALVVDGAEGNPADARTAQGTKDPAAAQQLPPGHPPMDGMGADTMAEGEQQLPPGHPPIDGANGTDGDPSVTEMPAGHPSTQGGEGQVTVEPGSIPTLTGEGVVTVSKLYGEAASYEGKKVRIAAKILRATPNVLGKNWLHVGDGTGTADKGDHDLVVTTQAQAQPGDVVIIEGVVTRNKDLGSGYRYDVLVEDAQVKPLQEG